MKEIKLYKVEIGFEDESGDAQNWRDRKVIAKDAIEAIKKIRLRKDEYVAAVHVIDTVDVK